MVASVRERCISLCAAHHQDEQHRKKQAGGSASAAARNPPLNPRSGYFRFVLKSMVAVSLAMNAALHQFDPGRPGLILVLNTPVAV